MRGVLTLENLATKGMYRFLLWSFLAHLPMDALAYEAGSDLTQIPFEELVQQEVVSASKLSRQISDSPSTVTIITADDIRAYGYRTVADAINSIPGLFTTWDRGYAYLGGRGLGRAPGDYTGRIMLLVDGYATQDSIYSQAFIDNSGLLDMELIERIEYVPGTGSAVYGGSALLGIINIVTRKGSHFNTAQIAGEIGSLGSRKQRFTYGKKTENDWDVLFSVSSFTSTGQDVFNFPGRGDATLNQNIVLGHDYENGRRFFAKAEREGLVLETAWSERVKSKPYMTETLSSRVYDDRNGFVNIRYETDLSLFLKSSSRLYFGYYGDRATREYDDSTVTPLSPHKYRGNTATGKWWGWEQQFVATWFHNHLLLWGAEYRNDYSTNIGYDYFAPDFSLVGRDNWEQRRQTLSMYFTDEYTFHPKWKLNFGGRYDRSNNVAPRLSPRVALIHTPSSQMTVKAAYTEAFRIPGAYDLYDYGSPWIERLTASELIMQYDFSPHSRFTSSLYQNQIFNQSGTSRTKGIEFSFQQSRTNGTRLKGSLARQQTMDVDGLSMTNVPRLLAKLNFTLPLPGSAFRTGIEWQYYGSRIVTETRRELGSVALMNLTLSNERKWHGWGSVLSIRNLFDKRYEAVAPFSMTSAQGIVQDTQFMDGRTLWLQLSYDL